MVSIENRLTRMVENGIITEDQAATVRSNSNINIEDLDKTTIHKKMPVVKIIFALIALFIGVLIFSGSGTGGVQTQEIQNVADTMNKIEGVGEMSKTVQNITGITIIFLPVLLCVIIFMFLYNNIVSKEEDVMSSWAQVETNYQRRADLIPNLVNTVKGFAEQEENVLIGTTDARNTMLSAIESLEESKSEADKITKSLDGKLDNDESLSELALIQQKLGSSMKSIFALAESYPNLKSSESFLTLQDQLEGTENRINVSRMLFNDAVRDYNSTIRRLPTSVIANMSGFNRKAYFEADDGNENKIDVNFNNK